MKTATTPKTIIILHDRQPERVYTVDGHDDSDVTYKTPEGHLASASWSLLFIREAVDLCMDGKLMKNICSMVGMTPQSYDWSFIRDADSSVQSQIALLLFINVGRKMHDMGLTSVAMFKAGPRTPVEEPKRTPRRKAEEFKKEDVKDTLNSLDALIKKAEDRGEGRDVVALTMARKCVVTLLGSGDTDSRLVGGFRER